MLVSHKKDADIQADKSPQVSQEEPNVQYRIRGGRPLEGTVRISGSKNATLPLFAATLQEELTDLKGRISRLEGTSKDASTDSLSIGGGITYIIQGSNNSNADALTDNGVTDASYSADLELEKEFDSNGKVFIHLETGDGAGLTDELQLFSNVNADADDADNALALTEAWYEHYYSNGEVTLTVGRLDASSYIDTNEYANDETTNFLGDIFNGSPLIGFPDDNGMGVRMNHISSDSLEVDFVAAEGDGDSEDIFDNSFIALQINLKSSEGNYRVFAWQNNKNHTKWEDSNEDNEKGNGFGISFDQKLNENLAAFARYSIQNGDVYPEGADVTFDSSWSLGLNISGSAWGRGDDHIGLGYGVISPSDEYKESGGFEAKDETHIEAYYNFAVNENISISPDIQFITNPYGGDSAIGDDNIFVAGLRGQISF